MSFFPSTFDPRDDIAGLMHLVSIETATATRRFLLGTDGVFTDTSGNKWYGSQLFTLSQIEVALNGAAPAGQAGLSYFQDPDQPELIDEIKADGDDAIAGRAIKVYVQPLTSLEEMQAPALDPILFATRTMRGIIDTKTGPSGRQLAVTFEGPWEFRSRRRGLQYTTIDHETLIGEANVSLELMPTDLREDEKLFG